MLMKIPRLGPNPNRTVQHVTLEKLLELILVLLQHDAGLCMRFIKALRSYGSFSNSILCENSADLSDVIGNVLEKEVNQKSKGYDFLFKCWVAFSNNSVEGRPPSPAWTAFAPGEESPNLSMRKKHEKLDHKPTEPEKAPWFPPPSKGGFHERLFLVFDDASKSICGKVVLVLVTLAIIVSTVSFILETMPEFREVPAECAELRTVKACEPRPVSAFFPIEVVCIVIFSVDYVVRVFTFHGMQREKNCSVFGSLCRTLRYARQPMNIIDLFAVLPFYVDAVFHFFVDDNSSLAQPLKVLRLARVCRLFKMAKNNSGMQMFSEVMVMSGEPLLILLFFNSIITVVFASLMYYAEGQTFSVDPRFTSIMDTSVWNESTPLYPTGVFVRKGVDSKTEEVTPFWSIPMAIWWVCVTMTTVGYGDYTPTTFLGKAIGVICFYVGVLFLALPISVLGTNFEICYERIHPRDLAAENEASAAARLLKRSNAGVERKNSEAPWFPQGMGIRRSVFILFEEPDSCRLAKASSFLIIGLILISTAAFVMETMPTFSYTSEDCVPGRLTVKDCKPIPIPVLNYVEIACIVMFTVEYLLRVCCVHAATPEDCGITATESCGPVKLTALYCSQWLNLIDLLSIAPFYVGLAGGKGMAASFLRILRLVRIFRVLRMPKLRACVEMFLKIIVDAFPALSMLMFMTTLTCLFFASCIAFAEGTEFSLDHFVDKHPYGVYIRPKKLGYGVEVSPFQSAPYAFWWFFATATTVGYGDDYPTTAFGRSIGVLLFYVGIVLLALPITVVGGSFTKYYHKWVHEYVEKDDEEGVLNGEQESAAAARQLGARGVAGPSLDRPAAEVEGRRPSSAPPEMPHDVVSPWVPRASVNGNPRPWTIDTEAPPRPPSGTNRELVQTPPRHAWK